MEEDLKVFEISLKKTLSEMEATSKTRKTYLFFASSSYGTERDRNGCVGEDMGHGHPLAIHNSPP